MPSMRRADGGIPCSSVLVDGRRVGVWRHGSAGGWPLVWDHGGLSCGLDATGWTARCRRQGCLL